MGAVATTEKKNGGEAKPLDEFVEERLSVMWYIFVDGFVQSKDTIENACDFTKQQVKNAFNGMKSRLSEDSASTNYTEEQIEAIKVALNDSVLQNFYTREEGDITDEERSAMEKLGRICEDVIKKMSEGKTEDELNGTEQYCPLRHQMLKEVRERVQKELKDDERSMLPNFFRNIKFKITEATQQ